MRTACCGSTRPTRKAQFHRRDCQAATKVECSRTSLEFRSAGRQLIDHMQASIRRPEYDVLAGDISLMKLLLALVVCSFAVLAVQAGQETRLHLTRFFPDSSPGRVVLTASSAQRDVSESGVTILHLSGNVEVRVITCRPGQDRSDACDV